MADMMDIFLSCGLFVLCIHSNESHIYMTYVFPSCGLYDSCIHWNENIYTWLIIPFMWLIWLVYSLKWITHIHDLLFLSCGLFDLCIHICVTRTREINDTYAWLMYSLKWMTYIHDVCIPFMWPIWLIYPLKWITHIHDLFIHFMWPIWLIYSCTYHTYTWNKRHIHMTYMSIDMKGTYTWLMYEFHVRIWLLYPLKWMTHIHDLCIHFMWPIWLMCSYTYHTYTWNKRHICMTYISVDMKDTHA